MTDPSVELLRSQAARDRHLARVERLLAREGVSLTVADRVSGLVSAPVGADDKDIDTAIQALRRDLPGVFGAPPAVGSPSDRPGTASAGLAEAEPHVPVPG